MFEECEGGSGVTAECEVELGFETVLTMIAMLGGLVVTLVVLWLGVNLGIKYLSYSGRRL